MELEESGQWVHVASVPFRPAGCTYVGCFGVSRHLKMLFQSVAFGDLRAVDEKFQQRRDQPPQLHMEELGTKVFYGVDATQLGPPVDGCFERIVPDSDGTHEVMQELSQDLIHKNRKELSSGAISTLTKR